MNQSASRSYSADDSTRIPWVSTRPLRQPAIGRKPSVIACSASKPLTLPAFCCRCGQPTKDLRPVKTLEPKDTKTRLLFLLMGHVGPLIASMRRLALKKIKVPICAQCWALHRLGILFGLASITIALTVFMGTFFLDPRTLNRLDFWLPSVLFLGCPLLIALGLGFSPLIPGEPQWLSFIAYEQTCCITNSGQRSTSATWSVPGNPLLLSSRENCESEPKGRLVRPIKDFGLEPLGLKILTHSQTHRQRTVADLRPRLPSFLPLELLANSVQKFER